VQNIIFSHIYIEEAAQKFPLTNQIATRLKNSRIILVKHYKDVFNKPGQNFTAQKNSPKLILAVRDSKYLTEGSQNCDSFGHSRFFYATQMMNCLYGCEYCYLRGMYSSANVVAFVNVEDYMDAALREDAMYCALSYDSDLLAFELLFNYVSAWINFLNANPSCNSLFEVRTKSANFFAVEHLTPPKNLILSWTLSPDEIILRYEHKTPSLQKRLDCIKKAIGLGWRVRLCVDPVLHVGNWEDCYFKLADKISGHIDIKDTEGISIGGYRIPVTFYRRIKRKNLSGLIDRLPLTELDGQMQYAAGDDFCLHFMRRLGIIL